MRIHKEDKYKTAFKTRYSHFKYQVMPFSLFNTLTSFQGYIIKILAEKLDVFVIDYLEDILIWIDEVDHVNYIWWVLNQLWKYFLNAKLKKCWFHYDEMQLLGYVISLQNIYIEAEQIKAICDWSQP